MIFKKIPKPKSIKGNSVNLAKYLTEGKDKNLSIGHGVSAIADYLINPKNSTEENLSLLSLDDLIHERTGRTIISNIDTEDLNSAVKEIMLTQKTYDISVGKIGKDSKDHNYHMVMSFPNGERPSDEDLKDMENRICSELGFSNNQRYSVQHIDTNNFHVHIVINQVNTETLTKTYPKHDYAIFNRVAAEIEEEYGLEKTNHKIKKKPILNVIDIHESGQSFLNYMKNDIKAADFLSDNVGIKWDSFHAFLNDNGVGIKKQGNGLIFFNLDTPEIAVKASSVDRKLSLKNLESFFDEKFKDSDIALNVVGKNKEDNKIYDKLSRSNKTNLMNDLYSEYLEYKDNNNLLIKNYYSVVKEEKDAMTKRYEEAKKFHKGNAYLMLKIDMTNLQLNIKKRVGHKPEKTKSFSDFLEKKMNDEDFIKKMESSSTDIKKFKDDVAKHKYKTDIFDYQFIRNDKGAIDRIPSKNNDQYGNIVFHSKNEIVRFNDSNDTYSLSSNLSDLGIKKVIDCWSEDVKKGKLINLKCDEKTLNKIFKTAISDKVFLRFSDHQYNVLFENKKKEIVKYERARARRNGRFRRSTGGSGSIGRIKFSSKFSKFDRFLKDVGRSSNSSRQSFDDLFSGKFSNVDGESIVFKRTERGGQGVKYNIVTSNSNATDGFNFSNAANSHNRLLFMQGSFVAHDRVKGSEKSKGTDQLLSNNEKNSLGSQRQGESERDRNLLWERVGRDDDVRGIGFAKFANKQTEKLFDDGIINQLKVFLHACKKNLMGSIDVYFKISKNDVAISRVVVDEKHYNEKFIVNNVELGSDTELVLSKKDNGKYDIAVKDLVKEKSIIVANKGMK